MEPPFAHPKQRNISTGHSLSLRLSERKLMLAIGDLLILNVAILIFAGQSNSRFTLDVGSLWDRAYWFIVMTVIWLILGSFLGVYDLARAASPLRSAWISGWGALIASTVYLLIPFLTPALPTRRIILFAFPILVAFAVGLWRIFYAYVFAQPVFHQRALVIGAGTAGKLLAEAVANNNDLAGNPYEGTGYQIVGFIDDNPKLKGKSIAGIPVLGTSDKLLPAVKTIQPYEVVVAITHRHQITPQLFQVILDCREMGIPVTTMTELYELVTGKIPIEHAGQNLEVILPIRRPASFRVYLAIRRVADIILAIVGCLFLFVLIPFVWLFNRFTDPGDLFYRQERVGIGGKPFYVIKFRSMVMGAEKHTGAVWANENDSRITLLGRFLRTTRLDEVPQFWNILRGDMSLIGPRPERPHFVEQLAKEIPFYRVRHAVKPGITGWAQVKYRYGSSVEDAHVKLEYDLYYIKYQSAFLDLQILLKTIQVMFRFKGR